MSSLLNEKPFLSLIIPTYNVERYVARCLESCVNQTYKNIEIIIVDDCGSDESIKIAEEWSCKDPRIKIIYSAKNVGTFLARKAGIESATGEHILFLDPDDTLLRTTVDILRAEILKDPVDILFFNIIEKSQDTNIKVKKKLPKSTSCRADVTKHIFLDIKNPPWGIAGKLYSARVANEVCAIFADFNERLTYSEDVLFLYAAATIADSCRSINEHLYVYYKNEESITEHFTRQALQWKLEQSELSIQYLIEINHRNRLPSPHLVASLNQTTSNIRSSMFKITRHCPGFHQDKNSYVHALTQALRHKKEWKDVVRLILYFSTLGKLKL